MKEKKIPDIYNLPAGMQEPMKIMMEMVELLPVKISKLNAQLHASKWKYLSFNNQIFN